MITELRKPGTDEYFITLEAPDRKVTFNIWKGKLTGKAWVSMSWGSRYNQAALLSPDQAIKRIRELAERPEWHGATSWDDLVKNIEAKAASLA